MSKNELISNHLKKAHDFFLQKDSVHINEEINKCFESLYEKADLESRTSKTKRFHIISKFILGSNGSSIKELVFEQDKIIQSGINKGKYFLATDSQIKTLIHPWSLKIEIFFGYLESHVADILLLMAGSSSISFNYNSFEAFEQRFATVLSIKLAYFRAELARKFNDSENKVMVSDEEVMKELSDVISTWLVSGRVWYIDIKSKKIDIPFSPGIKLSPFDYDGGKNSFYLLPFSTGYMAYSTSVNSPLIWSFFHTQNILSARSKKLEEELNKAFELNSSLYESMLELPQLIREYQEKDLKYKAISEKQRVLKEVELLRKNAIDYFEKNHNALISLQEETNIALDMTGSVLNKVKNGGDLLEINFSKGNMIMFFSALDSFQIELKEYSYEYFELLHDELKNFYSKEKTCFVLKKI